MVPTPQTTAAVIVTFHPDDEFVSRAAAISAQCTRVIIVDNGSSAEICERIRSSSSSHFDPIFNGENLGIAAALNIGCQRARDLGFEWVLLFDQDTQIDSDFLSAMSLAYESHPQRDRVRIVGANFLVEGSGYIAADPSAGDAPWIDVRTVITSGTLMPTSNLVDIGIFREDFFIDMVDHEYCLRARKLGFLVMITRKPLMRHSLNSPTTMSLLGKELTLTNSAVFRRYFIARNCLLTAREYWRTDFLYILRTTFGATLIALLLKIPLEKEHRKAKMAAVLQGIADGLRNRSGAGTRALPR